MNLYKILLSAGFGLACWTASAGDLAIGVTLNPTGDFTAKADTVKGSAEKSKDGYTAKGVTVEIKDLDSGIPLRDNHMKDKYFEVGKFPKATLKEATAKDGKFSGVLEVHGKPNKIEGTYTVAKGKLTAKFKTKLSDYEIKKAIYMGVGVEDEVDVTIVLPVKGA